MNAQMTSELVADALMMAAGDVAGRRSCIDQGIQQRIVPALARRGRYHVQHEAAGRVWDNSAMESFFSTLKTERVNRKVYRTRDEPRADVFDYAGRFYNPRRVTRRLGT